MTGSQQAVGALYRLEHGCHPGPRAQDAASNIPLPGTNSIIVPTGGSDCILLYLDRGRQQYGDNNKTKTAKRQELTPKTRKTFSLTTTHCPLNQKRCSTNGKDRIISKTTIEPVLLSSYPSILPSFHPSILPSFHRSPHRSIIFHTYKYPRSFPHVPLSLPHKTIMLTKKRTNITKKTSSGSIAFLHPTPSFRCCTNTKCFSGGLSNDIGMGCS